VREDVRKAIRCLRGCEDISFVGEAATISQTVQKAQELLPDIVIFDLHMAEGNSLHLPAGTRLLSESDRRELGPLNSWAK
jgi:DNA-binding NarL/FixJ family response regulator